MNHPEPRTLEGWILIMNEELAKVGAEGLHLDKLMRNIAEATIAAVMPPKKATAQQVGEDRRLIAIGYHAALDDMQQHAERWLK